MIEATIIKPLFITNLLISLKETVITLPFSLAVVSVIKIIIFISDDPDIKAQVPGKPFQPGLRPRGIAYMRTS